MSLVGVHTQMLPMNYEQQELQMTERFPQVTNPGSWYQNSNPLLIQHPDVSSSLSSSSWWPSQNMFAQPIIQDSTVNLNLTVPEVKMETMKPNRLPRCRCPECLQKALFCRKPRDKEAQEGKLYSCVLPGCEKVYSKFSYLKLHLRWHAGDRPYVCSWFMCGKRFIRSDELQRHYRIHTGEKRFMCNVCNKRFVRSDHLNKHVMTHNKTRSIRTTASSNQSGVLAVSDNSPLVQVNNQQEQMFNDCF